MIVLASGSPRRRALLEMLGIAHVVEPVPVDESRLPDEPPERYAVRLARAKAAEGARRHAGCWALGADTVVVVGGELLGKPQSPGHAVEMLKKLAGNRHRVVSAVALARGDEIHDRCDVTTVWFRRVSPAVLDAYVATGEPLDKAGAYAVQGKGAVLVERIEGDFFGVVGLPLRLVADLLDVAGTPYSFTR